MWYLPHVQCHCSLIAWTVWYKQHRVQITRSYIHIMLFQKVLRSKRQRHSHLRLTVHAGEGEECASQFSTIELQNNHLHCPLTRAGLRTLQALIERFTPEKTSQSPPIEEDELQIPHETESGDEEEGSLSHRSQRSNRSTTSKVPVAVLAEVDETAFQDRQ